MNAMIMRAQLLYKTRTKVVLENVSQGCNEFIYNRKKKAEIAKSHSFSDSQVFVRYRKTYIIKYDSECHIRSLSCYRKIAWFLKF